MLSRFRAFQLLTPMKKNSKILSSGVNFMFSGNHLLIEANYVIQQQYFINKIVLTTARKNCSIDRENFLKFEAEGLEFAKF